VVNELRTQKATVNNPERLKMIDLKLLVKSGVHFGHQTSRWNPRMAPYIWGHKNNVHLIDVSKTVIHLEKAAKFLESVAAEGKSILWIGTKKSAQKAIDSVAKGLGCPYVTHRWIGGTITNFPQVKKSVTKLLHLEDVLAKAESFNYTKKELNMFQKNVERLKKNIGGIVNLRLPLGAVVVVDVRKESSVIKEASVAGIPVVGLVDTNSDPSLINFVIPANDDAPKSISVILNYLAESTKAGQVLAKENPEVVAAMEMALLEKDESLEDEEFEDKKVAAKKAPFKKPIMKKGPRTFEK